MEQAVAVGSLAAQQAGLLQDRARRAGVVAGDAAALAQRGVQFRSRAGQAPRRLQAPAEGGQRAGHGVAAVERYIAPPQRLVHKGAQQVAAIGGQFAAVAAAHLLDHPQQQGDGGGIAQTLVVADPLVEAPAALLAQVTAQVVAYVAVPLGVVPVADGVGQRLHDPQAGARHGRGRRVALLGGVEVGGAAGDVYGVVGILDHMAAQGVQAARPHALVELVEAVEQQDEAHVLRLPQQQAQRVFTQKAARVILVGPSVGVVGAAQQRDQPLRLALVVGQPRQDGHGQRWPLLLVGGRQRQHFDGGEPGQPLQRGALAAARLAEDDGAVRPAAERRAGRWQARRRPWPCCAARRRAWAAARPA